MNFNSLYGLSVFALEWEMQQYIEQASAITKIRPAMTNKVIPSHPSLFESVKVPDGTQVACSWLLTVSFFSEYPVAQELQTVALVHFKQASEQLWHFLDASKKNPDRHSLQDDPSHVLQKEMRASLAPSQKRH